jgi:hypothetical protein
MELSSRMTVVDPNAMTAMWERDYHRESPQHGPGTERYLTRFLMRREIHVVHPQAKEQRIAVLKKVRASKPKSKRTYEPRIVSDHIMVQEDFERLHKFLLETKGLSEVSDDMRELVEEEWPELMYKLPPKAP